MEYNGGCSLNEYKKLKIKIPPNSIDSKENLITKKLGLTWGRNCKGIYD